MITQLDLDFNPPPPAGELFKYGSQQYKIYELLRAGGATSVEIQQMGILSHTRRITDIREKLKPHLINVEAKRQQGGVFLYKLKGIERARI